MGKTSLNTEESYQTRFERERKIKDFLKRMDFARRVWSRGMGVNFVQKEYFNTNYKTGRTVIIQENNPE